MLTRFVAATAGIAVAAALLGSTSGAVKAQAPAGAGPSVAPRSHRQHPLVPPGDGTSPAQPHGPSDNSPVVLSGTWQALTNTPPAAVDNCLLLTSGVVMCHGYATSNWYKLTPTSSGSYVSGTWSQLASMQSGYAPIYFSSAVLPDGRVIVEGGEYNCAPNCSAVWGTQGSIYNPVTNTWTPVSPPVGTGWNRIGDASGVVLSDGTYFQSACCSANTAIFNPATLSWTNFGSGKVDGYNDEESWTLLPNGRILTVDVWPAGSLKSEWFDPITGLWSFLSNTPVSLGDNASNNGSFEIGPGVLRPNGTVFAIGANPNQTAPCCSGFAHTAVFNTVTNTWTAGPDIPNHDGANDAPAAVLPNGNVLLTAAPPASVSNVWTTPTRFYEFDGTSILQVASPTYCSPNCNFVVYPGGMLVLPTGQVLYTKQSSQVQVYTASGAADASWRPTINSVPATLTPGQTYQIDGTQFNGLTEGAYYGDDQQSATNFPLVRLTNQASGHVFYARTHNHSHMGVATGSLLVSTSFDVPAGIELGSTDVEVVTNGIASAKRTVSVGNSAPAPTVNGITPTSGPAAGGTNVTITGSNFVSGATVALGGTAATNVVFVNSGSITATTSAHAAGLVNVVVTNPDAQTGTLSSGYTYVPAAPAPSVSGISPTAGPTAGGTNVTITGSNFVSGASVALGGTAATNVVFVNSGTITATTPAHAAGAVNVVVTNPDAQSGTLASGFTYRAPPSVNSINPNTGLTTGGTSVTIGGASFVSGATVTLGGSAATNVVFVNSTTITATTPAHAAGAVNVVVTNPDTQTGTLSSGFTYLQSLPAPTLGGVAPNKGASNGGTKVNVTGTNFVSGATVTFGGVAATSVTFVSSTKLTAIAPAHAQATVSVTVMNPDGQSATQANAFTYRK